MNTNRKKLKKRKVSTEEVGTNMTGLIVTHSSGVTSMIFSQCLIKSLLTTTLNKMHSKQLNPQPKRWRFQEWHDHLMAETWKIQNPNHDLPQKLFPQPISTDGHTFFQPIDTHQLAHWGRAVHNCVGGTSYM